MKKGLFSILFMMTILNGYSQTLNGEQNVEVGQTTYRYELYDQVIYSQPDWEITLGTPVGSGHNGNYYVDVRFDQGEGNAVVAFKDGSYTVASLQITVSAAPPATPVATLTIQYNCGNTVVSHPGLSADTNFSWYWQTTSSGTSTALGFSSAITRTSSGNLYLRARLKAAPYLWSVGSLHAGNIAVNTSAPAAPSVPTHGLRFGAGALTLSTAAVSGAYKYRWYAALTGGTYIQNSDTAPYTLSNVTLNATYYVSTWNGCESTRLAVNATILPMPTIVATGPSGRSINMGESVTLSTTDTYNGYVWKNAAGTTVGTSATYATTTAGTYSVVASKAGSANTGASAAFEVLGGFNGLNMNFVTTNAIQVPGITNASAIPALPVTKNFQTTQYIDGLGRPVQSVTTQGSPLKKDIIQPVVYDDMGREYRKYLAVAPNRVNGWFIRDIIAPDGSYQGPATNFYDNGTDKIADDDAPFAETLFENSPLNRPLKSGSPGMAWQPNEDPAEYNDKSIKTRYETNSPGEIPNLVFNPSTGALSCGVGSVSHYPGGSLSVSRVTDEEGNEVVEYRNKKGQVVCKMVQYATVSSVRKYAKTFYLYDDLGNLMLVLQPEFMKLLEGN